jgi:hypothetical protein
MNAESFPDTTLGTISTSTSPSVLSNPSSSTDTIDLSTDVTFTGSGADDYAMLPGDCSGDGVSTIVLQAGQSCTPAVVFYPGVLGSRAATMMIQGSSDASALSVSLTGTGTIGYYQVDAYGDVASAGDANYYGDTGGTQLNNPIVGMAATGDNGGYWLVASDGGIFSFGDAAFYGSAGALHLAQPIVAMSPMPTGNGYWFSAADGGLFNYGDAPFYGSGVGLGLGPVVAMAPDGQPTLQGQLDSPAIRGHIANPGAAALRGLRPFAGS